MIAFILEETMQDYLLFEDDENIQLLESYIKALEESDGVSEDLENQLFEVMNPYAGKCLTIYEGLLLEDKKVKKMPGSSTPQQRQKRQQQKQDRKARRQAAAQQNMQGINKQITASAKANVPKVTPAKKPAPAAKKPAASTQPAAQTASFQDAVNASSPKTSPTVPKPKRSPMAWIKGRLGIKGFKDEMKRAYRAVSNKVKNMRTVRKLKVAAKVGIRAIDKKRKKASKRYGVLKKMEKKLEDKGELVGAKRRSLSRRKSKTQSQSHSGGIRRAAYEKVAKILEPKNEK